MQAQRIELALASFALSNSALVEIHNIVAPESPVQKFNNKEIALKRTALALEVAGKYYNGTEVVDAPADDEGLDSTTATEGSAQVIEGAITADAVAPTTPEAKLEAVVNAAKEPKVKTSRRAADKLGMIFPRECNLEPAIRQMSNSKGRDWQKVKVTLPNGDIVEGDREMKRGINFYFDFAGKRFYAKVKAYPNHNLKSGLKREQDAAKAASKTEA